MYTLKKEFKFEAAHKLVGHDGKCARLHGHSWVGRLILMGPALHGAGAKEGMLVDFGDVKAVVGELVDKFLDHHYLNETLETDRPTSEFVAAWVYAKLKPYFGSAKYPRLCMAELVAVEIEETCTSSCTYGGGL